jgi:hypothetical protein
LVYSVDSVHTVTGQLDDRKVSRSACLAGYSDHLALQTRHRRRLTYQAACSGCCAKSKRSDSAQSDVRDHRPRSADCNTNMARGGRCGRSVKFDTTWTTGPSRRSFPANSHFRGNRAQLGGGACAKLASHGWGIVQTARPSLYRGTSTEPVFTSVRDQDCRLAIASRAE